MIFTLAAAHFAATASATVVSVAGNDTLVGNRALNLITNGSFEADGGVASNLSYWATGTSLTPTVSLTGWSASGQISSYATWGNNGLGGINSSATFPHGTNGLYFGGGIMASVTPLPIEAANGLVSFATNPVITPKPTDGPVILQQTVSGLNPASTYVLDFWASGESADVPAYTNDGFFGLDITGESRLYFAAPSGNGPIGPEQRYQVYFVPMASTVTFEWINWGHYMDSNGYSDEIVLDDVILNRLAGPGDPLDCSCLTNITVTCPGIVPDLCTTFANCFGTNMMPGSCTQNFPPGFQFNVGTYSINLAVQDLQSNYFSCNVVFTVLPPSNPPPLTVVCPTNKTVECNTQWYFDSPTILSSCCGVTIMSSDATLSQTGCSEVIERTWQITDGCGNTTSCSQKVTTVDTTPPGRSCGINMVPNGSFERTTNCPGTISQFDFASPWFTPSDGTSDLYSSCGGPWSYVSTPTNGVGVEPPASGQNYAGATVWSTYGLNTNNTYRDYREYLEVPMRATLIGGQRYLVSFYVSRAENYHYAIAEIGAYFSKLPLQTNGFSRNFNVVPQIENSPTNLLASTNGWTLVQGTFIAVGNEEHMTIGNFRTDANTTWTNANPGAPLPDYAYYYFDDVSVTMICDPITNKVVECGQPWDWDLRDQSFFDNCSGIGLTINTATTTNGYCPDIVTREWGLTDSCGNTNYFSQTVTNVDNTPPKLQCTAGANLVPNPQFENMAYCPYFFSQVSDAGPWFNPTVATPDYMNTCATFPLMGVPTNAMGNELAFSGNGYMGIYAYTVYNTNPIGGYREYIEAPLLASLQAGMQYQISFRVSLAETSRWAIANLGAHFSVGPINGPSTDGVLSYTPQVVNPPGNWLTNKSGWTLIQDTFTAVGGEDHITLGNFATDALTPAVTNASGTNLAYYYIDDVSVVPLCVFTNKTVACGDPWSFDTPLAYDECSGTNVTMSIANTVTNNTCPQMATRTWLLTDQCGNTDTCSQAVTFVDNVPPTIDCSCLQTSAAALLTTNACVGILPDLCPFTNCFTGDCASLTCVQSPVAGSNVGPGTNFITLTITDCTGGSASCVVPFLVNQPASSLSVTCASNKTVECGSAWDFDKPTVTTTCCDNKVSISLTGTVTNGICPKVITGTFQVVDGCGNTASCSQTVTNVDTMPPVTMCSGVNLVPNGDFESYGICPDAAPPFSTVAPWYRPTLGSPDYFNACAGGDPSSVPTNVVGVQAALSGQAYVGAILYYPYTNGPSASYREYIQTPLLTPLVAGQSYLVSFHVSLADTDAYAIANIGAHLSVGPVLDYTMQEVLAVVPQVVNPSTNLLASTNSWMLVQGVFTAVGGEDHLTLGSFVSDAATTAIPAGGTENYTYYYYDDVSIVAICSAEVTNKTVPCGETWDFDTPIAFDTCSGTNVTVAVASTVTNSLCPFVAKRTWTLTDACNNSTNFSQTVTIWDTNPPVVMVCAATNLVPNGQFESYTSCPGGLDLLGLAAPWYLPTPGTADYFNTCASPSSGVFVPTNWIGGQTPYSGQGYAGLYAYSLPDSYREYLQVPLLAPLATNQTYTVSFRVSLADNSGWAVAELGAHFSVGQLLSGNDTPLNVVPQVVNPSTNLLTSTNSWMLVQGTFTAAGGETHLTLGNFLSNAVTTITPAGGYEASIAYYYFDDVSVTPACAPGDVVPVKYIPCGGSWEFDTVFAEDACAGTNITTTINTVTNSLCPFQVTRTWTFTDPCTNSTSVSQTVAVTNNTAFTVNCDCLMDALLGQLTTNACSGVIPLVTIPSNSPCITGGCGPLIVTQSPSPGTPVGVGQHNITLNLSKCTGVTNQCVVPFTVNPPVPIISCPAPINVIGCSNNSAVVSYTATATGNVGPIVYSPPSGSVFPLGTNLVSCTATSSCGGVAICYFNVIVRPVPRKFPCFNKAVEIISFPPPTGRIVHLPDFPDGGLGADIEGLDGTEGIRLDLGPAEKFTFSTVLDFTTPTNASFELRLPPSAGTTTSTPLVLFERAAETNNAWNVRIAPEMVSDPTAKFPAIAINQDGRLFDSVSVDHAALDTNVFARIELMNGATSVVVRVTLDLLTREVVLGLPNCNWTPSARHKGWDGCIYGPDRPRPATTNKAARVIITPLASTPLLPITELTLAVSNLTTLAFDNPLLTISGRKWSDGHVTLLKAYDDGAERGMEFYALANGGGVKTDLGHAASFSFRLTSLDTNGLPPRVQEFAIRGWLPGAPTNHPAINLRFAPNMNSGGVDASGGWFDWCGPDVTIQLWNGTTLVNETNHVPATLTNTLVTFGDFPRIFGVSNAGVVSLSDTNPIVITSGLDCGSIGCVGTELRIIPELSTNCTPPTAYAGLEVTIGEDMDYLLHQLQITPACTPGARQFSISTNAVDVDWGGEGFRLQGAESVFGPWYDLEVETPATIPANAPGRVFRLRCD